MKVKCDQEVFRSFAVNHQGSHRIIETGVPIPARDVNNPVELATEVLAPRIVPGSADGGVTERLLPSLPQD